MAHQALEPHHWSRAEYDRMTALGALEDLEVELLEGVIVEVSREEPQRAAVIQVLTGLFAPAAATFRLRVQQPVAATDDSEPEPDLAIASPPSGGGHPGTADLAVEVVVSRRDHALQKVAIYAAAGVTTYWIVDVPRRQVVVHERPGDGVYQRICVLHDDDRLEVPDFGIGFTITEVFARAGL